MDIKFIKATESDIPLIRNLAEAIWWRHYPDMISDDQIAYMLEKMYSEASIGEQMQSGQHYTLIYSGNDAVGYYAVSEKEPHHFFLNKFYVDTTKHRKGIGSAAFKNILKDCKGYEEIALQVNRRNVKAVNFYFKHGFTIAYAKDFDFGGGYTMDDFWMVLKK
ncbi:MAG: Acetyltransferase family [Bacteroidetes bacterium]|nr:Acetyltransferase family [Bacteroidota bacterium]